MFRTYFKITFRNIFKHKVYSIINIIGLSIGISSFILIILFVLNELNYDKFNKKYENIYRLEHGDWAMLGTIYSDLIKENFEEIESSTRIDVVFGEKGTAKYKNKTLALNHLILTEKYFFDIFTLPVLEGSLEHSFTNTHHIILTKDFAKELFGDKNPIGKIVQYNDIFEFKVTAIIDNVEHFHIPIKAIAPFVLLKEITGYEQFLEMYDGWNYLTYLLLKPETKLKDLEIKINNFFEGIANWEEDEAEFHLRPLKNIYLSDNIPFEKVCIHGNTKLVVIFIVIAILILLIASINFINLTTSRASIRTKEIAVKKVLGASRKQLIFQLLGETMTMMLIATFLSIGITELILPYFNILMNTNISIDSLLEPISFLIFCIGIFILGMIAGFFPAIYLTNFEAINILQGNYRHLKYNSLYRKILIIFQYTSSIILLIGTLLIFKQLFFMKTKDLGFDKKNIVTLHLSKSIFFNKKKFRERLINSEYIQNLSFSNQIQGDISWQETWNINGKECLFTLLPIDPFYMEVMGISIKKGRNFNQYLTGDPLIINSKKDNYACILNESAVKNFEIKQPLGKILPSNLGNYSFNAYMV